MTAADLDPVVVEEGQTARKTIEKDLLTANVADEDVQDKWYMQAARRLRSYVTLTNGEGLSETQLADAIRGAQAGSCKGSVGCLLDRKLFGETRTTPHLRVPPFNEGEMVRHLARFTRARGEAGKVNESDMI